MLDLYLKNAQTIFPKSLWSSVSRGYGLTEEEYPHQPLERLLKRYFGNTKLGDLTNKVLISSYAIEDRRPFFFKSWRKKYKNVLSHEVCRATSAAPTYFEPAPVAIDGVTHYLVDGGIFVNNPCVSAYAEAKLQFPDEDILVVSLGTGEDTRQILYEEAKGWGKLQWIRPLIRAVFDGVSDTADYQMQQILGNNFYRFQVLLLEASDDMDCTTAANLNALQKEGKRMVRENKRKLGELLNVLAQ